MYFAHNFGQEQLEQIFNSLSNPSHFKSKFQTAIGNDGTQKFLWWFMNLSRDNQLIVVEWVDKNYMGVHF